jgi:hypothetical protein
MGNIKDKSIFVVGHVCRIYFRKDANFLRNEMIFLVISDYKKILYGIAKTIFGTPSIAPPYPPLFSPIQCLPEMDPARCERRQLSIQLLCSIVPVKNYEQPKMSVMMHSFVPLLLRDKEHPMHKWHARLSIDTMKSLHRWLQVNLFITFFIPIFVSFA